MIRVKCKCLAAVLLSFVPLLSVAQDSLSVAPAQAGGQSGHLGLSVDALAFFRDNEYDSRLTKGYSLPGAWVRPALFYNPNEHIHLELGAHALFFDGANKYPNYAYHDIATWKGNQYQDGAHLLPWLRAQASMKDVTLVLGDIYGDVNHGLIEPLYNREQVMSADPEMGAQVLVSHKGFSLDAFLNWQSYQFEEDTHQEVFIVGVVARTSLEKSRELNATLNVMVQHRGGEQDITDMGVQTLYNASIGIDWRHPRRGTVSEWRAQANVIGCYQQAGTLWPFDSGLAFHAEGGMELLNQLSLRLGYFLAPSHFVSLYGNTFFSTVGIRDDATSLDGISTAYLHFDYHRTFCRDYTLGAFFEGYQLNSTGLNEFNFAFGLYLRVTPKFLF